MTEEKKEPNLQILSQYIKDLSFEAPNLPEILTSMQKAPEIAVNVDVQVQKKEENFTVALNIKAEAAEGKKTVFLTELSYEALVLADVPAEHLEPVLLVEIPLLMFPFARAIISNITRDAGFPALQIAPIDFAKLYLEKKQQQAESTKTEK